MLRKSALHKNYIIITVFCPRAGPSLQSQGTKAAVLLGINRCGSFQLLSPPQSLFNIWTNLKRSEKIPGAPTWRWGEWIWLTGPSGLHRNWPQGLNISSIRVFDQIRDPEIQITLRLQELHIYLLKPWIKKSVCYITAKAFINNL